MTTTVIIVTLNRPKCVRRCLECLAGQVPAAEQVIVVDASADDRTRRVVGEFEGVLYVRNPKGYGHMTHGRNIGLLHARGDVIAFIDDDAFAHPGWVEAILEPYEDSKIGGVGGRALRRQPGEEVEGMGQIGQITPGGEVHGFFAADPGRVIEVDHLIGCNMSWRRSVLADLGGLREEYPGTEVREETDIALRVRKLGYRLVFNPAAVVDHIGAPQAVGQRFDWRYVFYGSQNHCILLIRNYGFGGMLWRYLGCAVVRAVVEFGRRIVAAFVRLGAMGVGTASGIVRGTWLVMRHGRDPVRRDEAGREIGKRLSQRAVEADYQGEVEVPCR
jgi:GT2 family glycosyltransferase